MDTTACKVLMVIIYAHILYVPELVVVVLTASEATDSGGGGCEESAKRQSHDL